MTTAVTYLALLFAVVTWLCLPLSPWTAVVMIPTIVVYAYFCWHYQATVLLQWLYDRELFEGKTVGELDSDGTPRPLLMINASSLVWGEQLLFTPEPKPINWEHYSWPDTAHRTRPIIPMPRETKIATAVAASSAIPAVFTPLIVDALIPGQPIYEMPFYAVDGGVYDIRVFKHC